MTLESTVRDSLGGVTLLPGANDETSASSLNLGYARLNVTILTSAPDCILHGDCVGVSDGVHWCQRAAVLVWSSLSRRSPLMTFGSWNLVWSALYFTVSSLNSHTCWRISWKTAALDRDSSLLPARGAIESSQFLLDNALDLIRVHGTRRTRRA